MGYVLKAGLGLSLFAGALILFNVKLVEMLEIGTCASGNVPFQISKPCPEGVGTSILLIGASTLVGTFGAILFALRGEAPWTSGRRRASGFFGWGTMFWGLFFTVTGAWTLVATFQSETMGPDGELGGRIVAGTFLVMGVPALGVATWSLVRGAIGRDPAPSSELPRMPMPSGPAGGGGTGDVVGRIERLARLRDSGALTDAEFEREKTKLLSD